MKFLGLRCGAISDCFDGNRLYVVTARYLKFTTKIHGNVRLAKSKILKCHQIRRSSCRLDQANFDLLLLRILFEKNQMNVVPLL